MLKLYVILFLFAIATSEVNIEQFYGQWLPIIEYPNKPLSKTTICIRLEITRKNTIDQCKCVDRHNVPVVEITNVVTKDKLSFPVLTVNSSAEVAPALRTECKCNGSPAKHLVFRPVNENYFIEYEHDYIMEHLYSEKEPNRAHLLVKKAPSVSELQAMSTYDDLSDRVGGVLCLAALSQDKSSLQN